MNDFITLMKEMPGFFEEDTVSMEVIVESQKKLDLKFSAEYVKYLQEIGSFTSNGVEFTGIFISKYWGKFFILL
ncbi:MAG: SMI1/KNR4 family protein [Ruminococcus flavefaciens]|nr:SMI1/KNR4 family protein [Ruminococcus flavefaciens]